MSPDSFRHEDATFQVPTTLPPQAETFGQLIALLDPAPPPAPVAPLEPDVPPLGLPPLPLPPPVPRPPEPSTWPPVSVQPVPAAAAASVNAPKSPMSRFCIGAF